MYSRPSSPSAHLLPVAVEHQRRAVAAREADGIGRLAVVRHVRRNPRERADVGLGRAVQVVVDRVRPALLHRAQVLDREHLAGKQHEPQARGVVRLEAAELRQQRQDRRRRVPHGELVGRDELRQLLRVLAQVLRNQEERGAVLDRDVDVEDRQVEVERRVAAEAILLGGLEDRRTPVHEAHGVLVREHHAFRHAGRAGGVEDVGEIGEASWDLDVGAWPPSDSWGPGPTRHLTRLRHHRPGSDRPR